MIKTAGFLASAMVEGVVQSQRAAAKVFQGGETKRQESDRVGGEL